MMIPFLESAGGNCHLTVTLVEEVAVAEKFMGAFEGTENEQHYQVTLTVAPRQILYFYENQVTNLELLFLYRTRYTHSLYMKQQPLVDSLTIAYKPPFEKF